MHCLALLPASSRPTIFQAASALAFMSEPAFAMFWALTLCCLAATTAAGGRHGPKGSSSARACLKLHVVVSAANRDSGFVQIPPKYPKLWPRSRNKGSAGCYVVYFGGVGRASQKQTVEAEGFTAKTERFNNPKVRLPSQQQGS